MAEDQHDRFEPARRGSHGLSPLDPDALREKVHRKPRVGPLMTVVLSAAAGAATGYLIFSEPPEEPTPTQHLASTPAVVPTTTTVGKEPAQARPKPNKQRAGKHRRFDRIVVADAPSTSRSVATSGSAPVQQTEAPRTEARSEREPKQRARPEFRWPSAQLFHLYRKRDQLHYYTTSPQKFDTYQTSEGFKPRLSPGLVYGDNVYPKKLRAIHPYGLFEPVYVFMRDQGDSTVPLYRLRNFGGNKDMYTSWDHIKQAWIDKGWADEGIAGYIYRPA